MTVLARSYCPYGQLLLAKEATIWQATIWPATTKETCSWNQDATEGQSKEKQEAVCFR